jgi:hypothetical protein
MRTEESPEDQLLSKMELFTQVSGSTESGTDLEVRCGLMEAGTKDIGETTKPMARAS